MAHSVDVNSISSHLMVFRAVQLSLIFSHLQKTFVETTQRSIYRKIQHTLHNLQFIRTRKLSYSKDDRAMRVIYGCPENFRESMSPSSSLIVSRTRLSTVGDQAFPVAAARVWNSICVILSLPHLL